MPLPEITAALVTLANTTFTANSITCNVFDGEPPVDQPIGDTVMAIGHMLETGTSGDYDLGMRSQWDTYEIVGYIRHTSGDTATTDDRNLVWAAWMAFRRAVQQDSQLGTQLITGGNIRPAGAEYQPTTEEDLDGNAIGTYAQVTFRLTVTELVRAT